VKWPDWKLQDKEQTMEIKDFLCLMWRGAKFLILGLALGIAIGVAASILQSPDYEASTKVLVNRPRQQSSVDLLPLSEDQLVTTNALMVKTKPVLDETAYELGIKINPDNITVSVLPNTMVIQIKVQNPDPKQAAAIANTLVKILIKENENILAERYAATESALTTQIDQVQKQIESLQSQYTQLNDASIQEQLKLVGQQIDMLKSNIASLEQDINGFPNYLTVADQAALAQKQAQLEQQRSLLTLYQQIQVNLTFTGQPGPGGANREIPSLTNIQSNINLYQQIYLSLQNSLEANRSERTLNTPDILQMDPAVPPKVPVRPLPALYILLGALVGFSLAASAILLIDHINNPLKSAAQIEKLTGLPVLGSVTEPVQPAKSLVNLHEPASASAETFRALAAAIEIARGSQKSGALMVMNAGKQGAKSGVSANLAVAYAQQGRQVTLVDGDLVHPHLHQVFSRPNASGLADLADKADGAAQAGQKVEGVGGLTLFTAGQLPAGPAKWMNAERWDQILSKLHRPDGILIVDSPSVETADAQTLASKVNAILLVVRQGQTPAEAAQAALRKCKLAGANVLGVVLEHTAPAPRFNRSLFSSKKAKSLGKEALQAGASKIDETSTQPS
jgi:capsular exopolysaccharide synthesis family protein